MPNHIHNEITLPKGHEDKILRTEDGEQFVDFNLVIECPPIITTESAPAICEHWAQIALGMCDYNGDSIEGDGLVAITKKIHISNVRKTLIDGPFLKDASDENFNLTMQMIRAYKKTGFMNWYDWNIANWGTKWNAYETKVVTEGSSTVITFDTAWSAPFLVLEALANKTDIVFVHRWASEDTGSHCGRCDYVNSDKNTIHDLSGTKAGYELAFELDPETKQYFRLNQAGDNYEYFEGEE